MNLIVASNAWGYPFAINRLLRATPQALLNTEFYSVAACSANDYSTINFQRME